MSFVKIVRNKYFIATAIFLGYLLIVDQYNFRAQYRLMSELSELEDEKEFYRNEFVRDSSTYSTLFDSKENLEKYAREKFIMKKPHEDIFIIVKEED